MTEEEYLNKGKYIWKNYVPKNGQSDSVQGELLRAVVKLQDEAQRNGNMNWDEGHVILAKFILKTIEESNILDNGELKQFKDDIERVLDFESPYIENDLYKRLEHAVIDFYMRYPEPIKHKHNPDLHR
jgi:hypothetical protein